MGREGDWQHVLGLLAGGVIEPREVGGPTVDLVLPGGAGGDQTVIELAGVVLGPELVHLEHAHVGEHLTRGAVPPLLAVVVRRR